MKRSLKNVIMGFMLFVVLLLLAVTVYKATDERVSVGSGMGGPGDPGGLAGAMGGTQNEDGSITMPDGTIVYNDGTGILPGTTERVELPEGTMPAPPGGVGSAPPGGAPGGMMNETEIKELDTIYYIYFGIESLVFLLILAYMILSGFNKKELDETFNDKLKFILLAIIAVFGTAIFTYACGFISDVLADKIAEIKEAEANTQTNNESQGTTDPNMGMGTTTDPNAGTVPEGGEVANPDQNQNMDAVPGTQVQPNEVPNQEATSQPTTGETPPTGNPMEGGQTPPQMP